MGVQVAGWSSQQISAISSSQTLASAFSALCSTRKGNRSGLVCSPFLGGAGSIRLLLWRTRSLEIRTERRRVERASPRAVSASPGSFSLADDGDDEDEFVRKLQELSLKFQRQAEEEGNQESRNQPGAATTSSSRRDDSSSSSVLFSSVPSPAAPSPSTSSSRKHEPQAVEPPWLPVGPEKPDWPDQIVPASVEKNANSVDLPLSLRIIKRKKRRWEDGFFREAGEAACGSVQRAFSSMVFMIRELQSYALQLREALFYEDLQGILARVQQEMNSSFVWLFQQIFSCTPALMVSVMLLLANFTVYSMDINSAAIAATAGPSPPTSMLAVIEDNEQHQKHQQLDNFSVKTFSVNGRTASIGGSGGGGKVKPVAGATDDGRSDESPSCRAVLPDGGISSTAPSTMGNNASTTTVVSDEEAAAAWSSILEEANRMKASTRDEVLMDYATLRQLVSPVTVELEPEDKTDYLRTELMYQGALLQEPGNVMLLSNFAQFLYLVLRDHDRAEYYFKRAAGVKPADAEALSQYASFLWLARKNLAAAEETYLEAIAADPGNTVHAANYAHFLWSTGGEDTCFPLDSPDKA